jgi:hypothetical protein
MKALYNEPLLELQTPEGMAFSLPLAGPVPRLLALWVDLAIVMVAGGLVQKAMAVVPYALKIAFGVVQLGALTLFLWRGGANESSL